MMELRGAVLVAALLAMAVLPDSAAQDDKPLTERGFVRVLTGRTVFVPFGDGKPLDVVPGDVDLPAGLSGIVVDIKATKIGRNVIRINHLASPFVAALGAADFTERKWWKQADAVRQAFERAKHKSSTSAGAEEYRAEARKCFTLLTHELIDDTDLSDSERIAVREIVAAYIKDDNSKALYGTLDNFTPECYRQTLANSRSAIALRRRGGGSRPFCSGVLIGDDVALTCWHCTRSHAASELEVVFDYQSVGGQVQAGVSYPILKYLVVGNARLDFTLVQLGTRNGKKAGASHPKARLSSERVGLDDAIYVIGHPNGSPLTISDNAFALFPFKALQYEVAKMLARCVLRYAGDVPARDRAIKDIKGSYAQLENGFHINRSLKWNGERVIGADCDTFHGNSGSAAYSKRTHRVVGLLYRGEPDAPTAWKPGWHRHEAILPIELVWAEIIKQLPKVKEKHGVKME